MESKKIIKAAEVGRGYLFYGYKYEVITNIVGFLPMTREERNFNFEYGCDDYSRKY